MSNEIDRIIKAVREGSIRPDAHHKLNYVEESREDVANEARAKIAADNGLPIERVLLDPSLELSRQAESGERKMQQLTDWSATRDFSDRDRDRDREFLLALDRQLADAVTFLPPAMRASFHAQVGALIRLVAEVAAVNHSRAMAGIERAIADWRAERSRIAERTR